MHLTYLTYPRPKPEVTFESSSSLVVDSFAFWRVWSFFGYHIEMRSVPELHICSKLMDLMVRNRNIRFPQKWPALDSCTVSTQLRSKIDHLWELIAPSPHQNKTGRQVFQDVALVDILQLEGVDHGGLY